jgi:acyl dehydratase
MASPIRIKGVHAIKDLVGSQLGPSDWITVSQERIDAFAAATGDRQWIHVDVDRSRLESPFKQTIAHGYLTLSLTPAILPSLLEVEGCSQVVNYGIDKLRLREPVPAGSRLRLGARIKNVRNLPTGAARVTLSLRFEAEGVSRPVCVGDVVYVYYA